MSIAPFNSLPFFFFLFFFKKKKTNFISIQKVLALYFLTVGTSDPSCMCLRRSLSSKELFRKRFISPLVQFSEHLCVALFREENITKTLSNYCWPFISLVLLNSLEMNILAWESCPFSLWGWGKSSPRSYLWSPSWQNVSNGCDVREVKTTMRRAVLSSFAFPRLVQEQKPTPCHSLHFMVHLLWFIPSKLSSGWIKKK